MDQGVVVLPVDGRKGIQHPGLGIVRDGIYSSTRVLVVGAGAHPAWVQRTYGAKILAAVEMREAGHPIFVVPEEQWVIALGDA